MQYLLTLTPAQLAVLANQMVPQQQPVRALRMIVRGLCSAVAACICRQQSCLRRTQSWLQCCGHADADLCLVVEIVACMSYGCWHAHSAAISLCAGSRQC